MDLFFRIYKHLLPRSRAWSIIIEKTLRNFFEGLTGLPSDFKDFIDEIWLDILPATTRQLSGWETQFGIVDVAPTEQGRRDALEAAWQRGGGQGPDTLEDVLRGAGFDVYVHDPWFFTLDFTDAISCGEAEAACGEAAVECGDLALRKFIHDPNLYLNDGDTTGLPGTLLVNKILIRNRDYVPEAICGEALAQCGEVLATCGNYSGFTVDFKPYVVPGDPNQWAYFWYIGGVNFGDVANVPAAQQDEFETIILKIGPTHTWAGLFVNYV